MKIDLTFGPADFPTLRNRDLSASCCVVYDVFRATTTMTMAIANGAAGVIPVSDIEHAVELGRKNPAWLLAGERNGFPITREQSAYRDFDFGNSPREFHSEKVTGKTIVTTTTNGTRALNSVAHASLTLVGSFLNLGATLNALLNSKKPEIVIVCSGTFEDVAYEDVLGAGALISRIVASQSNCHLSDSAQIALQIFELNASALMQAASFATNGRKLLSIPSLREDVAVCLQTDTVDYPLAMVNGVVLKIAS